MTNSEQQALIDRLAVLLEAEPEVEAAWLAGSLGAGGGDAFSDVDVLALANEGAAGKASAALSAKLSAVAEPVLVNNLFGGRVVNVVTGEWQRFDISFVEGSDLAAYDAAALTPLFNRGERAPPVQPPAAYEPKPERVLKLVQEFLRILGLAVVVVGREEYQLALSGIDHLRRMTLELMLEENRVSPVRRGGALHRNPLLTAEQREALAAVPPQAAERDSVIAAHGAFAAVFLPRARRLAAEVGVDWPTPLEEATRRSLSLKLGLNI